MIKICAQCNEPFELKSGYRKECFSCNPKYKFCQCGKLIRKHSKRCKECDIAFKRSHIGDLAPFWKGGRWKESRSGYIVISIHSQHIYEHRHIWKQTYGTLPPDWVVHHINGVKDDNRIENLFAMPRKGHGAQTGETIRVLQKRILELERLLPT